MTAIIAFFIGSWLGAAGGWLACALLAAGSMADDARLRRITQNVVRAASRKRSFSERRSRRWRQRAARWGDPGAYISNERMKESPKVRGCSGSAYSTRRRS